MRPRRPCFEACHILLLDTHTTMVGGDEQSKRLNQEIQRNLRPRRGGQLICRKWAHYCGGGKLKQFE